MDFDIEYFSKKRPDLWKDHYYNKIYVGKHGAVSDEKNNLVITDWRSPIGGFFSDNENRFYDPDVDPSLAYNYELIMKRRKNAGKKLSLGVCFLSVFFSLDPVTY